MKAKFAAISANTKSILEGACSNKAAIYVINNDIDAIGRGTATQMLNVLSWGYDKAVTDLKTSNVKLLLDVK